MSRPAAPTPRPFPYLALFMVALAIFLSVTIEMLPTGLLSQMGDELGVSHALIGLTVSVFAFTVVATSAVLTHLTRTANRHRLLVVVLIVLSIATFLTAIAPTYGMLIAARVLGGLAHGLFWAVAGAYSAYLVPKEQIGRAVSIALGGGSLAFVLGLPLGTALGQAVGWRGAFAALGVLTIIGTLFVARLLPKVDAGAAPPSDSIATVTSASGSITTVATPSRTPRPGQSVLGVALVCGITAIVMVGHYSFYTYIEPFLTGPMGLPLLAVSPALFGYGIAGLIALSIVGAWLGARPKLGLAIAFSALIAVALVLRLWPAFVPASLTAFVLWGFAFGMIAPLLQTRMLHVAPARIRDTASALFTTAFNIGIGGGALLGSLALEGWGIEALPSIAAVLVAVALVLTVASDAVLSRRRARRVIEH